ncbi:MAG: hypothetical protein JSV85_07870 [Candidatus Bathyarchaeota archaeon]|nr:MAG: hypothetical protein JSV85_07870 [Candidatus Bathyarchaeota archaeon]
MRILWIAVLVIVLSFASAFLSYPRVVSSGWRTRSASRRAEFTGEHITWHGFPFAWYSTCKYTVKGQLETETFEFYSEAFIVDTIIYLTIYSVLAASILRAYRERAKLSVSGLQFIALVSIGVLICGIIISIYRISCLEAELDRLHFIREAPVIASMVDWAIEGTESWLHQEQTIVMSLIGLTALIVASSKLAHIRKSKNTA